MAEPLRHRQTKEADNRYVRPTATAPHLDSTIRDVFERSPDTSALVPTPDIVRGRSERREGPIATNRPLSLLAGTIS
jgi:hypothetical protein